MPFAVPLAGFTALLVALFVALFRDAFDDPIPERASITWAISCPMAGLLYGVGLGPPALISGVVSVLALGSLAWWFLVVEADDGQGEAEQPVEPDTGPGDDVVVEVPRRREDDELDWAAFDRARREWERELAAREREPQRSAAGV